MDVEKLIQQRTSLLKKYGRDQLKQANDPLIFQKLSPEDQQKLVSYCIQSFKHRKTPNNRWSSYGLKHLFEDEEPGGFYVYNGQFKGAMLIAGFIPEAAGELNWIYCISQKSPALVKHNKLSVKMV